MVDTDEPYTLSMVVVAISCNLSLVVLEVLPPLPLPPLSPEPEPEEPHLEEEQQQLLPPPLLPHPLADLEDKS